MIFRAVVGVDEVRTPTCTQPVFAAYRVSRDENRPGTGARSGTRGLRPGATASSKNLTPDP